MFHIVLYEPEIPPNTGNIMRLCANTGARLHLIEPVGFELDDRKLRRAGLDYRDLATVTVHPDLDTCLRALAGGRVYALSTRGRKNYDRACFRPGDVLLFGPETRGLPQTLLDELGEEHVLRLPMQPDSRSLNLSNTVAVVLYEAWRQNGFK
ncbi:MAG: tRNA (uridine(34)/cytosine(34)/5-carboxymethylaminomethyluridine(34)-2'-O)-methyltransferase TrmL [Granulosicoccaceae bacterium]|jgi:tRNA (cytidine/uridine-2'-O-)-methyltransferase